VSWRFVPQEDKRQQVRIRRLMLSAATSIGAAALAFVVAAAGYLAYPVAVRFAAAVAALIAVFYFLIRSGLNLRFAEPGLTIPQMAAAGIATSYLVSASSLVARPAFVALYFIAFMFGILALDTRRLLGVAVFYLACYAAAIFLSLPSHPETDVRQEAIRVGILALVLGGFTLIGGHVSRLRRNLKLANAHLAEALRSSESLARIDSLTGCYNRRHGLELLEIECKRAARGDAVTVCLADLDGFKAINDKFGHAVGDEVLKAFTRAVQGGLRATDALARHGGEEFLIVLSQTSIVEAAAVAERIRQLVEDLRIACLPGGSGITVSIGVAEHRSPETVERTVERADAALYRAKEQGRNRVVCASAAG
jgi:diguanylate cyclase